MTNMNLAVVVGIVSIIVCVTVMARVLYDEEIVSGEALMFGIAATLLVAGAVVLYVVSYNEEETEDYAQDCVCSCECCDAKMKGETE